MKRLKPKERVLRMAMVRVMCPKCENSLFVIEFDEDREKLFKKHESMECCNSCKQLLDWC